MMLRIGDNVLCWPQNHEPRFTARDQEPELTCVAIVTQIGETAIDVHYFLPEGYNGTANFPREPASKPTRGKWWVNNLVPTEINLKTETEKEIFLPLLHEIPEPTTDKE